MALRLAVCHHIWTGKEFIESKKQIGYRAQQFHLSYLPDEQVNMLKSVMHFFLVFTKPIDVQDKLIAILISFVKCLYTAW